MTTPEQLEAFAVSLHSQRVWTPTIQQQLMDLIREPAMHFRGQLIPANDPTKAMDNIFRCKPTAWDMGCESLGLQCQARMRLWYQSTTDTSVTLHCQVITDMPYATIALALTAVIARVWALIIRAGVMHDLEIPDTPIEHYFYA